MSHSEVCELLGDLIDGDFWTTIDHIRNIDSSWTVEDLRDLYDHNEF